jgi:AbrB family looped-hinge helix DNA binding protein
MSVIAHEAPWIPIGPRKYRPPGLVTLDSMTHKVGPKGQVVVPKELRERHGLKPGDEVVFDDTDGEIRIRRAMTKAEILDDLQGSMAGTDLLAAYAEEKRLDREREIRKHGGY